MSNIYITEPPTSGKAILETSRGEIEIELFADQCPLACKNFIALALEGYYDDLIWHRFVPDFIIQTGDPTATGVGGESFYGNEFNDEFHQRLRFNRRGLLGMANGGEMNSNGSQFFLTLANTPELQGKHTMFGRISNKTIYNLVALTESVGELGQDDRPVYPPKLKTIRIVENPFEGQLQLRITREEKISIQKNKKEAEARKVERSKQGSKKKNIALLSFGEEEDVEDEDSIKLKGPKSSHDLLKDDKRLRKAESKETQSISKSNGKSKLIKDDGEELVKQAETSSSKKHQPEDEFSLSDLRKEHLSKKQKVGAEDQIAQLEASIRGDFVKSDSQTNGKEKSSEKGKGKSLLADYMAKYKRGKAIGSTKRDEETAKKLRLFQNRMRGDESREDTKEKEKLKDTASVPEDMREYGASDEEDQGEDWKDWRNHRFDFGGKAVQQDQHDGEEYVTLDPRDSSSSAALQMGFGGSEGQRKAREEKAKQGRRGRDWVDDRTHSEKRINENGEGRKSDYRERDTRRDLESSSRARDLERW